MNKPFETESTAGTEVNVLKYFKAVTYDILERKLVESASLDDSEYVLLRRLYNKINRREFWTKTFPVYLYFAFDFLFGALLLYIRFTNPDTTGTRLLLTYPDVCALAVLGMLISYFGVVRSLPKKDLHE